MKKLNLFKTLFASLALATLTIILSCEKQEACERDNFGTVIVTNRTGQTIWVDVTQAGSDFNDERRLSNGQSTTYQMKPGQITEWAIEDWDYPDGTWYTDTYYLDQCETHNDPWTSGKKSTKNLQKAETKVIEFVEKER